MRSMLSGGNVDRFKRAALRSINRGIELVPWNLEELALDPNATPVYVRHEPGCDCYRTTCGGTCGVAHLTDNLHEQEIWWDSRVSCEPCPSKVVCQHVGCVVASDRFAWPDPPSAETLLRLVQAGAAIIAEEGTDPALKVSRLRNNYAALETQAAYLVGGRQSQANFGTKPAPGPEPAPTAEKLWRPISQAARERAQAMEF